MILFGFISIVQIFLPGLIFTKLFYDSRLLTKLILSFSLGLLFNYQFVLLMTFIGLNNRVSTWAMFSAELVFLVFIYVRKMDFSDRAENEAAPREIVPKRFLKFYDTYCKSAKYILIGFGIVISYQFAVRIIEENPGIFDSWDDVVSWNRWAVDWYNGYFPRKTYHYPQLMPANWSVMYQFIGTSEIQFFAKSIMSLFAVGILLIFVDLYQRSRSLVFLAAMAISGFLIMKVTGNNIGKGFADVPVTFFSLGIFYVFYLGFNGYMSVRLSSLLLACMLSAAVVTKQAGFFMILPSVFMSFYLLREGTSRLRTRSLSFLLSVLVFLSLASPWYIYKQIQIELGVDESEVTWVTQDIFAGKSKSERLSAGTLNFTEAVTDFEFLKSFSEPSRHRIKVLVAILFGVIAFLSVFSFYGRNSLFLVVLPYFLMWGWLFSYDLRNVTLLLPFLALSIGIGGIVLLHGLSVVFSYLVLSTQRKILFFAVVPLSLLVLLSVKYDSYYLFGKEREKASTLLGDAVLNARLYKLYGSDQSSRKTLSGYVFLGYLPEIKQHYVAFNYTKENLDELKKLYQVNKVEKTFRYFVLHETAPTEVWEFLRQEQKESGLILNLRSQAGWCIMEMPY